MAAKDQASQKSLTSDGKWRKESCSNPRLSGVGKIFLPSELTGHSERDSKSQGRCLPGLVRSLPVLKPLLAPAHMAYDYQDELAVESGIDQLTIEGQGRIEYTGLNCLVLHC